MKKRILSFLLAAVIIFSLWAVSMPDVSAAGDMTTSESCVELIKDFEGFSAKAFYDYAQYSIGYGTACKYGEYPNGITKDEADKLLRAELTKIEPYVNQFATRNGLSLSQQQFDALISFTYNLGTNWMNNTSTFRTAVIQGAKGNDFIFAMTMWCNAGGSIVEGLIDRRLAEANLYLNGIYSEDPPSNYNYVLFDNNMESALTTVKIQGYDSNQTDIFRASPSKAGYRFLGWYTKADGGEWVTRVDYNTPEIVYAHWQSIASPDPNGVAASYVRYAGAAQPLYDNPNGGQLKLLTAGTKLNIVADYMDNSGIKWGKLSDGGWVKLNETKDAESAEQGQAVNLKVTVNADGVNIRKGPGTSYPKNGTANKGQELQLTRVQQGGMYLWGQFSGGWICLDYTDYELASLEESENANKVTATGVIINTDKLNIRSRPSASSTKVGQYSKGDKVQITLQQKVGSTTWGKTDKGWISLYYVNLTPVAEGTVPDVTTPTEPETPTEPTTPAEPSKPETSEPEKNEVVATGKVTGCTVLRIRAGAGTKYAKVGSLAAGTKVSIYEMKVVGSQIWGRMDKGWICMTYVKLDSADSGSSGTGSTGGTAGTVVDCTNLNVRAGAGTSYARVGKLAKGTKVKILETTTVGKTVWGRISEGWVSMDYIKLDSAAPETDSSTQTKPEEDNKTETQPDDKTESGSTGSTDSNTGTTQTGVKTGVIVGTTQLRVRSAPDADSKQVGTLKKGDRVVILETAKNGSATWARIESGWIHMFYVKLDSAEVPAGTIIRTVTTTLRIRAGAGTSYEAVGSYLRGTQVMITDQTTVNGTVWGRTDKGWISLDYVK